MAALVATVALAWIGSAAMESSARAAARAQPGVSVADKTFLDHTYSVNEGEIVLGHLAERRGTTRPVTSLGRRMVHDHSLALDASKRVAARVHVALPTTVDPATKALYGDLSRRRGRDFDTAYLDAMVAGHQAAVHAFEQEAANGQNATIKGYAKKEVRMLREHLSLVRRAQQQQQQRPGVAQPQRR